MSFSNTTALRSWALVASSALLQVFIFPTGGPVSPARCAVSWMALVPFFVALGLRQAPSRPLKLISAAILGYVCGILWYLGNCYWIYQTMYLYGGLPKPVAAGILILFSLYLALYHLLFALLFLVIARSRVGVPGALAAAPFLWVAVELLRGQITGFPWDLIGYSQVDNLWLTRLAPLAGVMGMSFAIVAANSAFASFFFLPGRLRVVLPLSTALTLLLFQVAGTGDRRVHPVDADQTAVLMQENLAVGQEAKEAQPLKPSAELRIFSEMSTRPTRLSGTPGRSSLPAVIIWPEAPSHLQSNDPQFRSGVGQLSRTLGTAAIVGSLGVVPSAQAEKGYYLYDSASVFNQEGEYQGRYDKIHLVPWGEYIPFKSFFSFAHKLTEGAGDMDRGTERSVFNLSGHSYGVFICYESVFGDEVRHFAEAGAQVLVNISDDGWYGDSGAPWQHLNMTRMRAIENDRWLLLDTNTGVTAAIDPQGRVVAQAPRHVRDAYLLPFAFRGDKTLYTRWGDWFAWLCTFISLVAVSWCLTTRRVLTPVELLE